jgi:hypothetical protein
MKIPLRRTRGQPLDYYLGEPQLQEFGLERPVWQVQREKQCVLLLETHQQFLRRQLVWQLSF